LDPTDPGYYGTVVRGRTEEQMVEEAVWLTPAERKAQLEERHASYQLRLVLP
jgi:hypothetical protein